MEGYREGMWVEIPGAPSVKLLGKEMATEAVLAFRRDTRVGCMVTLRPPEGEEGGDSEGEVEEG